MSGEDFLLTHEAVIRFAAFAGTLSVFALLESLIPARERVQSRWKRWPANLLLMAAGAIILRFAFPFLAVGAALWAETAHFGLFHWISVPGWLAFAGSFLALDLAVYAQHVAMHHILLLWRFHRVHHADAEVDATTGLRFHPGEAVVSMMFKMAVVVLLGAPLAGVIIFEVALNAASIFNHANMRLAGDEILRAIIVTPGMHRIHHSQTRDETDSNYGFCLSLWDRIFGTWRAKARAADFALGQSDIRRDEAENPWVTFVLPFRRAVQR